MTAEEVEDLISELENVFNDQLSDLRRDLEQRIDDLESRLDRGDL